MQDIKIEQLSQEQIKQLRAALKAQAKSNTGNISKRNGIIDRMLHEQDEDKQFKHTTADILSALVSAKVYPEQKSSEDRAKALKMIQTRKQHLVAKGDTAVGYRKTETGIGGMTIESCIAYLVKHTTVDEEELRELIGNNEPA